MQNSICPISMPPLAPAFLDAVLAWGQSRDSKQTKNQNPIPKETIYA